MRLGGLEHAAGNLIDESLKHLTPMLVLASWDTCIGDGTIPRPSIESRVLMSTSESIGADEKISTSVAGSIVVYGKGED